jgi:hypothetical protein
MIETKQRVNVKINWHSAHYYNNAEPEILRIEKIVGDRKHYFEMLRRFLSEVDALVEEAKKENGNIIVERIEAVFKKYDVHFVDVDDIKRVNLDEPKEGDQR